MEVDKKIQDTIQGIKDGTLASKIRHNSKSLTNGVVFGAIAGFVLSTLVGGGKLTMMTWGAIGGGAIGYLRKKD